MKKYITPDMEVVEVEYKKDLLMSASDGSGSGSSFDDEFTEGDA